MALHALRYSLRGRQVLLIKQIFVNEYTIHAFGRLYLRHLLNAFPLPAKIAKRRWRTIGGHAKRSRWVVAASSHVHMCTWTRATAVNFCTYSGWLQAAFFGGVSKRSVQSLCTRRLAASPNSQIRVTLTRRTYTRILARPLAATHSRSAVCLAITLSLSDCLAKW